MVGNAALILPSRSSHGGWRNLWRGMTAVSAWVLGVTGLALLAITSVPLLAKGFGFEPLAPSQWLLALALGGGLLLPFQVNKWLTSRR